jgi:hypothetical protein
MKNNQLKTSGKTASKVENTADAIDLAPLYRHKAAIHFFDAQLSTTLTN